MCAGARSGARPLVAEVAVSESRIDADGSFTGASINPTKLDVGKSRLARHPQKSGHPELPEEKRPDVGITRDGPAGERTAMMSSLIFSTQKDRIP